MSKTKKKKKPRNKLYSKGELNYLVDSICHPLFRLDKTFVVLDGALHGLVEKNPIQTAKKFVKYNRSITVEEIRRLFE